MSATNDIEAAAIRYVGLGWPVLPLHAVRDGKCGCGDPDCKSPGKHPLTGHGLKEATTNTNVVRSWWRRWPDANVGVLTGAQSGIVVVDVDPRHGGEVTLEDLDLPDTLIGLTGGGGTHHVYRHPGFRVSCNGSGKIGPGVDFRGDDGYIVAVPSVHASGREYAWDCLADDFDDVAELPQKIIDRLGPQESPASRIEVIDDDSIPTGMRHPTLVSFAGSMRRRGMTAAEMEPSLQEINAARCRPPLERSKVARIARSIAKYEADDPISRVDPDDDDAEPTRPMEPCSPFPVDALPWVLKRFVVAGSEALNVDPMMVALPMLAVCAGAIGSTRQIKIKESWKEFPIVWMIVVSRSGQQKSPAFDLALGPLKKREGVAALDHEDELLKHRDSRANFDVLFSKWRSDAKDMIDPGSPPTEPLDPVRRRYYTSDTTLEALAAILHDNPRGILLARDELSGWLLSFNAYRQGRGGDEASWMEMSRGGTLLVDRKSGDRKTIHCDHACVSVVGTIQPRMLVTCLKPEYFASGLAARLLMAMPDTRQRTWTEADIGEDVIAGYDTVIERLLELDHDRTGDPKPIDIRLSPAAKATFIDFYGTNADLIRDAGDDDYVSALTKIEAAAARLALIIHLVRAADGEAEQGVISADDMAAGVTLARWFATEASRIYTLFRRSGEDQDAVELWEKLRTMGGNATARDLMRHGKYRTAKPARDALDDLVERGWATRTRVPAGGQGGRPSTVYTIVEAIDACMTEPSGTPAYGSAEVVMSVESIVSTGIVAKNQSGDPPAAGTIDGGDN